MVKILGVGGSPRQGGNSDILLEHILEGAQEEGADTKTLHLRDLAFKGCIGCERCRLDKICTGLKDDLTDIYSHVVDSRGLVLISPCHNYNVTSLMKAFIDRLYCFYDFTEDDPRRYASRLAGQGRKAALTAVCEQRDPRDMGCTMEMLRRPVECLGYDVLSEMPVYGIFHRGKVAQRKDLLERALAQGKALARALQ